MAVLVLDKHKRPLMPCTEKRTRLNKHGFPRGYLMRKKSINGFQTDDMVIATVPIGVKTGTHTGRVAVRATGNFNIQTPAGAVQGISYKHCRLIARADGYGYSTQPKIANINGGSEREAA